MGPYAMELDSPPLPPPQQQLPDSGQKRSSAEAELPMPANAKQNANARRKRAAAAAAAAADQGGAGGEAMQQQAALLRMKLTEEDAAEQRQLLQQQQQQQQEGDEQEQQQRQQQLELQRVALEKLSGDGLDVLLAVPEGSNAAAATRCLGVTLQLSVKDLKELADSRCGCVVVCVVRW